MRSPRAVLLLAISSAGRRARGVEHVRASAIKRSVQVWAGNVRRHDPRVGPPGRPDRDATTSRSRSTRRTVAFGTPQNPLTRIDSADDDRRARSGYGAHDARRPCRPKISRTPPTSATGNHDTVRIVAGPRRARHPERSGLDRDSRRAHSRDRQPFDRRLSRRNALRRERRRRTTLLSNVTSDAFVQVMNGRVEVRDSSFDRLRARGNTAGFLFDHTRARQIEVTTVSGPIVYDDGSFDAGARAFRIHQRHDRHRRRRRGAGRRRVPATDACYGLWDRPTPFEQRGDGEASATVAGGGPVVNAVTAHGNVYLYDGSLATRRDGARRMAAPSGKRRGRATLPAPDAFQRFRALRGRVPSSTARSLGSAPPDRVDGRVQIGLRRAVVHHVHADRELAVDARRRGHRDAAFLQFDHDARVERVARGVVRAPRRSGSSTMFSVTGASSASARRRGDARAERARQRALPRDRARRSGRDRTSSS